MGKMRKAAAGILLAAAVTATAAAVSGCGKAQEQSAVAQKQTTAEAQEQSAAAQEQTTAAVQEQSTVAEETAAEENTREITDMAGRTVRIPAKIEKAFAADSVTAIYLYTLDPKLLLGWNYDLNEAEKSMILPEYHDLPSFGQGDSINYEAVIAAGPQIALAMGSDSDSSREEADRLSDSLGIPVLVVSDSFEDTAACYRLFGEIFEEEERAEELAAYAENAFAEAAAAQIPEENQVTVYYGNGENSLETAPRGSTHGDVIDFSRGLNVAKLEGGKRVQISLEQLLSWDPDVIIVNGEPKKNLTGADAAADILENPDFASLKAVQNGAVYGSPNVPFSWVDRPRSANRVIGLRWLCKVFYPELFDYDMDEEIREFYQLFYHVNLTDEELSGLLGRN